MFDYQDAPVIESFTLGEEKDGRMDVSFRATQDEDRSYNYKIYAAVKKGGDEKELTSGSARTNSDVKTSVDLRSLSSYSAYMLKLYVWYSDNETDYFDQVYSEPFSYKNSDKASSMKDFGLWLIRMPHSFMFRGPGSITMRTVFLRRFSRTMKRSPPSTIHTSLRSVKYSFLMIRPPLR